MSLQAEVMRLTRYYVRTGGKSSRKDQRQRMIAFAIHCEKMGAYSLSKVGRRHVIKYWKCNRHLSDATLYAHQLAIEKLFELGKVGLETPRPWKKAELSGHPTTNASESDHMATTHERS